MRTANDCHVTPCILETVGQAFVSAFYRFKCRPARNWHAEAYHSDSIRIGDGDNRIIMINPTERTFHVPSHGRARGARQSNSYVLCFGAYAWTRLHVYACDLDDALEACAEWLAKHAPGHITTEAEMHALALEACEDDKLDPANEEDYMRARESAEEDMVYTESGWLTGHEWHIALENPTTEQLYQLATRY